MTLKKYLILMLFATLVCWLALGLVIFYLNPYSGGMIALVFFYVSLFFAVVGTFAIVGFIIRSRFLRHELVYRQVAVTFRQAVWLGGLAVIALWLQAQALLTWYNLLLLILVLAVFEFFLLSIESKHS